MTFEEFLFRLVGFLMGFGLLTFAMNGQKITNPILFAMWSGMMLAIVGAFIALWEIAKFIFDYVKGLF